MTGHLTDDYKDIIDMPHHEPEHHPRMTMWNRAAQFAPFAALTGYDAAIKETARQTDTFMELDDCDTDRLNSQMSELMPIIHTHPDIEIVYFQPDSHKAGGSYQSMTGALKIIDEVEHLLILTDGRTIPIANIVNIQRIL